MLLPILSLTAVACSLNDDGPVVPEPPLVQFLQRLQDSAFRTYGDGPDFDPKLYVDLSLKRSLDATAAAFNDLPRRENGYLDGGVLSKFIEDYCGDAEDGLVAVEPVDFVEDPIDFLPNVENRKVREWGLEVHGLWKNLSRRVSTRVHENPESYTLIPLNNPVVVPGSRFREVYYWDSYWIIRGLMASKMYETAKGIVYNLVSLLDRYGYVLNGARTYYSNRSQPPLLSSMVVDIYNRTGDMELVMKSLPSLIKEHEFWTSGFHEVVIRDARGSTHRLSRYYAMWNQPRPESATYDEETAEKVFNESDRSCLYRNIASAAESGWDFSTRWMRNDSNLATLATTSVVPVDLNAFILKMEIDIVTLANATGDAATASRFIEALKVRKSAIDAVLWNSEMGQWLDYWLIDSNPKEVHEWNETGQNRKLFASNFIPLWIKPFYSDHKIVHKVVEALESSGLICPAGVATSLVNSGQQWDFPNGWAPLQHMIAEGLSKTASQKARAIAEDIAIKWIRTNYASYKNTGVMHEKYDVRKCGEYGGGGEYIPQTGFGWSNGVVLAFLEEYGWPQSLEIECSSINTASCFRLATK